ncbi:3'(2'),5'-bisphosphate nucleotidase CysQ family protein [Pseudanabaena sp. Chao 1811]|uniref:inositol-phosphate phosphatase n=2 Tax=Pseudanabaena TaxID=1152 RepID=A0ABX1LLB2_9CYAN|nr:3'(2'),5'-bisphosphate nucleotidase CysQ [Pseudanabaena sp. Chao 1811]NMF56899.1 3'(2'),5'-bisphosphate nucleotidase CysQ [Pseudanabaena yagii GIHE-NHR1]
MLNLNEIMSLARPIAWGAGDILMKYYQAPQDLKITFKGVEDGNVTSADLAANDFILGQLKQTFGTENFAYLSEETEDSTDRLDHEWVWIIDPMDGTSDFIRRTNEFAVHIGLSYRQRPVLGLVATPAQDRLFQGVLGNGAYMETRDGTKQRIHVSDKVNLEKMVVVASRSHRNYQLESILQQLPKAAEIAVGSIGGKFAAIASGNADVYISVSGKSAPKDWDYCAPEIILTEAGGQLTHADLSPLSYNNLELRQWGTIVASNGHCHDQICQISQDAIAPIKK